MATLESNDSNILDAETINWRLIVYPIVAAVVLLVGGFGYYYYLQSQRELLETQARAVLLQARTPEAMVKVAGQFPGTDQATIALLSAADGSFAKRDFASAMADYQRVVGTVTADPVLRDSAQLGLARCLEASGKTDDAINAFLAVAQRGDKTPYAPYAYQSAADIYEQRGDKNNERMILTEAAGLGDDSPFVKQAQFKLKELNPGEPMAIPLPANKP